MDLYITEFNLFMLNTFFLVILIILYVVNLFAEKTQMWENY